MKKLRVANQIQSVHDKNVIDYMKRTWSKNVKGKTIYEVVDNNRMIDEFDERMREMGLGGQASKSNGSSEIKKASFQLAGIKYE